MVNNYLKEKHKNGIFRKNTNKNIKNGDILKDNNNGALIPVYLRSIKAFSIITVLNKAF